MNQNITFVFKRWNVICSKLFIVKKMNELTYHQKCFGWASGHYLADEVDKTFWELDDEEQLEFLENN